MRGCKGQIMGVEYGNDGNDGARVAVADNQEQQSTDRQQLKLDTGYTGTAVDIGHRVYWDSSNTLAVVNPTQQHLDSSQAGTTL
jgi:hypothetical protein